MGQKGKNEGIMKRVGCMAGDSELDSEGIMNGIDGMNDVGMMESGDSEALRLSSEDEAVEEGVDLADAV